MSKMLGRSEGTRGISHCQDGQGMLGGWVEKDGVSSSRSSSIIIFVLILVSILVDEDRDKDQDED
jgi:hypothetical protein